MYSWGWGCAHLGLCKGKKIVVNCNAIRLSQLIVNIMETLDVQDYLIEASAVRIKPKRGYNPKGLKYDNGFGRPLQS